MALPVAATRYHNYVQYSSVTVIDNTELASGHWLVTLAAQMPLPQIDPGQFILLRCDPADVHSLLRPFSILDVDYDANTISVYYKHLGRLSVRLSTIQPGAAVDCLYPLGVGFPWQDGWRRVALVGGGVGLAPMLYLGRHLQEQDRTRVVECFFGGNGEQDLVPRLLARYDLPLRLATMDGSVGYQGTVVELYAASAGRHDVVYTCGPNPMMAALAKVLPDGCSAYASLEEYMACGVGACYGCTAKVETADGAKNLRVCCDGPVFDLRQVDFRK